MYRTSKDWDKILRELDSDEENDSVDESESSEENQSDEAYREAIEYNVFREHTALQNIIKDPSFESLDEKDKLYKQARCNILEYIVASVTKDPENGDHYDATNTKKLREAGEMLYKEGGMQSMHDNLVWSFIPQRYHREIDMCWSGVGEWIA
jgi:hypothetical protein